MASEQVVEGEGEGSGWCGVEKKNSEVMKSDGRTSGPRRCSRGIAEGCQGRPRCSKRKTTTGRAHVLACGGRTQYCMGRRGLSRKRYRRELEEGSPDCMYRTYYVYLWKESFAQADPRTGTGPTRMILTRPLSRIDWLPF